MNPRVDLSMQGYKKGLAVALALILLSPLATEAFNFGSQEECRQGFAKGFPCEASREGSTEDGCV